MAWSYYKFLSKSHAYVNEKVFSIIMIFIKIGKKTGSHNYPISVLKIVNMLSKKKSLGSNDVKKKISLSLLQSMFNHQRDDFPKMSFFCKTAPSSDKIVRKFN